MKIKFDLNWRSIFGLVLILFNLGFINYWYGAKEEFISNLVIYMMYPFYSEPFGLFFTPLLVLLLLTVIVLFPFIITWFSLIIFPFKKSKEELEIKKATKEIRDKYKKIELENRLKKLKNKKGK